MSLGSRAQIVNHMRVDQKTFLRYASGRMQEFNPENLVLADSLYSAGTLQGNFRLKCLGLSLEIPIRYIQGNYERMDAAVMEIKQLLSDRKDMTKAFESGKWKGSRTENRGNWKYLSEYLLRVM